MHSFLHSFARWLFHLGAPGLVLLGLLDSSFLFLPFGNDLLLVGLAAQHHERLLYYVPVAALGSAGGCWLLDLAARRRGEQGLSKLINPRRVEYLKRKIGAHAALGLMVACLAPPPFPFTAVVAAASAFNYPRPKLLSAVVLGRLVRFAIVGWLAVRFGRRIIAMAKTPAFEWSMAAFIAICLIGSAMSVHKWLEASRQPC